ncbi:hypothetical protein [Bradyrhizobium sp.]|uniref:hypothetical protein n=1 Tax=Bradyrhizobium sp. TaxID=376 RepID=UPI00239F4898|nr:hypothetical protein [Bradyrhizobium sp.]MDE2377057.1 hypothetical protein [Bradyrhizobium sp.]
MLKYLAKISMDIFPSVLATIIGAYIVNHYINARPAADTPAAAVSTADTKKNAKPAKGATDVANLPAPGIKAKGISEKAVLDKPATEAPAEKAGDQPAEIKPAETKPVESAAAPRNHQPAPREKAVAKATPAPVVAAPAVTPPAVETGAATPATPDANDLARAAIERLRRTTDKTPEAVPQETARAGEALRAQEAVRVVTMAPPAARPLPPPITVSTPGPEAYGSPAASSPASPPYTASVATDDANRPTPPADIPVPVVIAPPLDLRADAAGPTMPRARANVADEMLSGVKSMFHAVLPKAVTTD